MRLIRLSAVAFLFGLFTVPAGAQSSQPDWAALTAETEKVLVDYLRINTSNPPGNEIETARFLKQILDREGIEATILDTVVLGRNRANLYARLKGNGSKKSKQAAAV